MTVASIRHEFPMLAEWRHFNCGGMAPLSQTVGAELLRVPTAIVNEGPLKLLNRDDSFIGIERARETVAKFIGCCADEIAFTTQFSTAVNIIVEGLDWEDGDEFIVTDQEHPAMLIPLMNVARRRGLVVKRIPVVASADEMLASYRELLTDRTKLVAVSHVTTDSGTILPAEEMVRLAHANGSLIFFDGAHSAGQIPLDVHALDCDFYALVGYKWLLGPYPSAALYIKRSLLEKIEPSWTGSNATKGGSVTMGVEDLVWIDGAKRFEYGGRTFSYDTAMAAGVAYIDRIGLDNVQAHQQTLTTYFHEGLSRIPGANIHSPGCAADGTGINTVSIESMDGVAFSAALKDRFKIVTRPALRGTTVRISLAVYVEQDDVDFLLESIETLAKNGKASA